MAENDEVFAFRAPQYLKFFCKALGINYGDSCRKVLEELCSIPPDGKGPSHARVPPEMWDKVEFTLDFEIKRLQLLKAQCQRLRQLPSAIQCTAKPPVYNVVQNGDLYNNVVQKKSAVQCTTTAEDLLRHIRVLVYEHLEDQEMARAYMVLDSGEDPGDLISEYWSLIVERSRSNGGDSKELVRKVELFEGDFHPYLSHVLYDMGETRADQQCDEEEAEA